MQAHGEGNGKDKEAEAKGTALPPAGISVVQLLLPFLAGDKLIEHYLLSQLYAQCFESCPII